MMRDISKNIIYLFESDSSPVEENVDVSEQIVKDIKDLVKKMKLQNSNIESYGVEFFSLFFYNQNYSDEFDGWIIAYTKLLSEIKFYEFFIRFILTYYKSHDKIQFDVFPALRQKVSQLSLKIKSKYDEDSLSMQEIAKTLNSMRQVKSAFMIPFDVIRVQSMDLRLHKFCNNIIQNLDTMIDTLEKCMRSYLKSQNYYNIEAPKMISVISQDKTFISECCSDFLIESYIEASSEYDECISEGIVNNVKERLNVINEKRKKIELSIDEGIMRKWKEFRRNQQNRKHSEIVGDAFRFTNEIKRVLKFAPAALINPLISIILWTISLAFDRMTDNADRKKLIDDIKDELEIMEEKIRIAERKGDDKERIQLIRQRQKLVREFERISKTRYQKSE